MSITEKIKAINNKINQNKAQYDLESQTAKILALSSGNACKYTFLTGKDVLPEKELLEKAAIMKRLEYLLLGKELKAQTNAAEKQYQVLNAIFESVEKEELVTIKKEKPKITVKQNLTYDSKYSISE